MQLQTVLLIILAAIFAFAVVYFQYFYKAIQNKKLQYTLGLLRFVVLFLLLFLLINPKITKNTFVTEKPNLVVLVDNSSSIKTANATEEVESILAFIDQNDLLDERFNTVMYSFGNSLYSLDSLGFTENYTNIGKALSSANNIYKDTNSAYLLLTDGNQNLGEDYEFYAQRQAKSIFPIVIGDTTKFDDLSIDQINSNKYAFLKNQFPLEILISYNGDSDVSSELSIRENGKLMFRESIVLNSNKRALTKEILMEASEVGIRNLKISLRPLVNEKNLANNEREIAIEVIDEKTNIALVTNMMHPDLGVLKKSIETNEQRQVSILKPNIEATSLDAFDLFILYQPDRSLQNIYDFIQNKDLSYFTIVGTKTDWNFLNEVQNSFQMNSFEQNEDVYPLFNEGFTKFDIKEFEINNLPPLKTVLGELLITTAHENILEQKIKGVPLEDPLFSILESANSREAVLFGEDIWKWRMEIYRQEKSFERFDDLWAKTIFYLADSDPKSRLTLDYQNIFYGSNNAFIKARYFDEVYNFEPAATLSLKLIGDTPNNERRELTLLLKNGYYEVDLSSLLPGNYSFEVSVENQDISEKGTFTILEYDLENLSLSSNYSKLDRAAKNSQGALFYPDQLSEMVATLSQDNRYVPLQKSNQNVVSLIDFKVLLATIVIAMAAEWFLRKYFGLI
ncbi:vWA domain-containing protein [Eudoraea chungangensis]|uniref:vWA domain-containing protein n=1 Tax=Eudoraea chungangensis TaxID=1481905 RepID=UPI0023EC8FCD|nr:vWA domain-containing protein [Eudoraea chungangensis]